LPKKKEDPKEVQDEPPLDEKDPDEKEDEQYSESEEDQDEDEEFSDQESKKRTPAKQPSLEGKVLGRIKQSQFRNGNSR